MMEKRYGSASTHMLMASDVYALSVCGLRARRTLPRRPAECESQNAAKPEQNIHVAFCVDAIAMEKNLQGLLMVLTIVWAKGYNIIDLSGTNAYVLVSAVRGS